MLGIFGVEKDFYFLRYILDLSGIEEIVIQEEYREEPSTLAINCYTGTETGVVIEQCGFVALNMYSARSGKLYICRYAG